MLANPDETTVYLRGQKATENRNRRIQRSIPAINWSSVCFEWGLLYWCASVETLLCYSLVCMYNIKRTEICWLHIIFSHIHCACKLLQPVTAAGSHLNFLRPWKVPRIFWLWTIRLALTLLACTVMIYIYIYIDIKECCSYFLDLTTVAP